MLIVPLKGNLMKNIMVSLIILTMVTIHAEVIDKKNVKSLPVLKLSPTQTVIIENELKNHKKNGPIKLILVCNKEKKSISPKLICQTIKAEKL